jgi:hypothetical protein
MAVAARCGGVVCPCAGAYITGRANGGTCIAYSGGRVLATQSAPRIVRRRLVTRLDLEKRLSDLFPQPQVGPSDKGVSRDSFVNSLFDEGSDGRKKFIGRLVNLFVTEATIQFQEQFEHPLLRMRVGFDSLLTKFLERLKNVTRDLVVSQAAVQQLERRGQRVIKFLYCELSSRPESLIPTEPGRYQGTPRVRLHSGHDGSLCGEDLSSALHSRNRYQPRRVPSSEPFVLRNRLKNFSQ